jgi:hypothetical protein
MTSTPLGNYSEFKDWTGHPQPWGPEGRWRATFAGGVIDDLVTGIRSFPSELASRYGQKLEPVPVALGCVPYFTSTEVAGALADMGGATLVIVNKGSHRHAAVQRVLEDGGCGFLQRILPGLADWGPLDETDTEPIIGPDSDLPGDRIIGPLRLAGWGERGARPMPLVHMKLLVLGVWTIQEGDYGELHEVFTSHRVWMGSANWTRKSSDHIEFGAWCDDPALVRTAAAFLTDLVRFSEPIGTPTTAPEPEMVAATWDDDAFYEAMTELRQAHEDNLDE